MINSYKYYDPNDIILVPFQVDLNASNGSAPDANGGGCIIVSDEKPVGAGVYPSFALLWRWCFLFAIWIII